MLPRLIHHDCSNNTDPSKFGNLPVKLIDEQEFISKILN